jgi:protein-S-isoprenylcysteine O-methyltransferase Ste14
VDERVFRVALAALLAVFVAHRAYYTRRLPAPAEPLERLGRTALSTIAGVLAVAALLATAAYIVGWAPVSRAALDLPDWARWTGVAVAIAGVALLEWAHRALGANWTDEPQITSNQELVESGPYRYVRHPMYSAFGLILGSTLLISANWLVGGTWIASWALAAADRISYEERALEEHFGGAFVGYRERTGRLVPRV